MSHFEWIVFVCRPHYSVCKLRCWITMASSVLFFNFGVWPVMRYDFFLHAGWRELKSITPRYNIKMQVRPFFRLQNFCYIATVRKNCKNFRDTILSRLFSPHSVRTMCINMCEVECLDREKGADFWFGRHSVTPLLLNSSPPRIIFVCSTNPISRFACLLLHHREWSWGLLFTW